MMETTALPVQRLLSLPPGAVRAYDLLRLSDGPNWFVTADPPTGRLGSGGGTAHLLVEAWRATGTESSFRDWLGGSRKMLVHGGGQSRRLPAYAPIGKPLLPLPALRGSWGQRLDQRLLDLQEPSYRRILAQAPTEAVVLVASGDTLLTFARELPSMPAADVVIMGMPVDPEMAQHFGVCFLPPDRTDRLSFFLQKPSASQIREHAQDHLFLVDTGLWLLSARAVEVLLTRCGWDAERQAFAGGNPAPYELYARFALSLGDVPAVPDPLVESLSGTVVALPDPEFYHLGTSRQMIEATWILQNRSRPRSIYTLLREHPDQITQNALLDTPTRQAYNHTLWIENAAIPSGWRLAHDHVLTGVPPNDWELTLEPGVCLDFVPVGEEAWCVRAYGMDDPFAGAVGDAGTQWLGRPATDWLAARGMDLERAGISPETDIQQAPLFPIVPPEWLNGSFVTWLYAARPLQEDAYTGLWLSLPRLSAQEIAAQVNLERLEAQRATNRKRALERIYANRRSSVFYRLDLEATAGLWADEMSDWTVAPEEDTDPITRIHEHMWRAAVRKLRGQAGYEEEERTAFTCLREAILSAARQSPVHPRCAAMSDQIVWSRAPVRLDLAGGWTDTPPYCLQHGGRVTNVAVNLNGQPPIQVFVRPSDRREIVIRSIDLGMEERLHTYEALDTFAQPGSEFALAKGALALAGFLPRFHANGGFGTLREHLEDFGGGMEISLLAAVPQGSGLGTSSILGVTLLEALSDLCGLGWDTHEVIARTLALEQMLTTGGGWQDQAGGALRGVKLLETAPGPGQVLTTRWLPEDLFAEGCANRTMLLYYTGLTRLAKNILQEIVRGMFLNAADRLSILQDIGANAGFAADAIQRNDRESLCEAVRRSWSLNRRLDAGTDPPSVQAVLGPVEDYLAACKLLGAGGGGYLLMLTKDEEAGLRLRRTLTDNPPNARARFVDLAVSRTGLETTRS